MRRDDGTFDTVEIANFEARTVGPLIETAGEDLPAVLEQIGQWRDYHTMTGRAEAIAAMAAVVQAAARGDTDQARQRFDKTLGWFERGGGQFDRDLAEAVDLVRDTLTNATSNSVDGDTPAAVDGPVDCRSCRGFGWIDNPTWVAWEDRYDAADVEEAAKIANHPPTEREFLACQDCAGTGRTQNAWTTPEQDAQLSMAAAPDHTMVAMSDALRAALEGDHQGAAGHFDRARQASTASFDQEVEDDIHALLDRTPRDDTLPVPEVDAAGGPAKEPADPSASLTDGTRHHAAEDAPGLQGAAHEDQDPEPTATDLESVGDDSATVAAPDGGLSGDDRDPASNESLPAVDRAERAVLELKGRRVLAEQYAQARERDDEATEQSRYTPGERMRRAALPPHVMAELTDFGD